MPAGRRGAASSPAAGLDAPSRPRPQPLRVGAVELDLATGSARRGGRALDLLPREFALLAALARRPGEVVSRAALFRDAWGRSAGPRSNLFDVHLSHLRRKLDAPGEDPMIETVRGVGLVFHPRA